MLIEKQELDFNFGSSLWSWQTQILALVRKKVRMRPDLLINLLTEDLLILLIE